LATIVPSFAETALGAFNTIYTPVSTTQYNSNDRLFVVGNGTSGISRSDALVIIKNGNTGIGISTPSANLEIGGVGIRTARITSTGGDDIQLQFKRAGSDWQIRNSGGLLFIGQSNNDLATVTDVLRLGGSTVTPASDNFASCGASSLRWTTVFAANGTINTSDAREKTNIRNLDYGLEDLMKLRPVSFEWINNDHDGTKLGLIAQEVQQVLPEVVRDWDWKEDEDGTAERVKVPAERLGMYYSDIIPVLVKGVQELNAKVETLEPAAVAKLEATVERQQEEINALKAMLQSVIDNQKQFETDLQLCCFEHDQPANGHAVIPSDNPHALGQNIPNPFRESTVIHYYLSAGTANAVIRIVAMDGIPVNDIELGAVSGHGQVEFRTSGLASGTYLYSLFVDGEFVATKKMIVAR